MKYYQRPLATPLYYKMHNAARALILFKYIWHDHMFGNRIFHDLIGIISQPEMHYFRKNQPLKMTFPPVRKDKRLWIQLIIKRAYNYEPIDSLFKPSLPNDIK